MEAISFISQANRVMQANLKLMTKMCEQYGIEATTQAKQALINFSVLYGQKLVRTCMFNRPSSRQIKSQDIRSAYQSTKQLHSPQYQRELQQRKLKQIKKINQVVLITQQQDQQQKIENTARTAVSVKLYESNLLHMLMDKERQLTYQ